MVKIGIIGGSGLDDPRILKNAKEIEADTPYGKPSSNLAAGKIEGIDVIILARHGKRHTIYPTGVNFQANIRALKEQGCTHIIVTTACGSLKGEIKPGDFVFIDQFIDRTTKRKSTFYEKDHVAHIPAAEPFCSELRKLLGETADELGLSNHKKGTVITIEGPRFSTKAESNLFRSWDADVINMSTVPEVVLAREAGICYASVAMSTDYDCWHESEEEVNIEMVLQTMKKNAENVKKLIISTIPKIKDNPDCRCRQDIKSSVIS
jgi:5'-methylthioadenosine phosphorylase|tara:strand:- start:943 stop:1734 length:792 start_codon:yes stop_codon:yes gene_type:complete